MTVHFTVSVDQADANGLVIPNVAQFGNVSTPECDSTLCDTNTVKVTVEYPVVTATKSQNPADGSTVRRGDRITYTITLADDGLVDAANVAVTDQVPAGTTFVSAADGGTETGGVVSWTVADVAAGTLAQGATAVTPGTPVTVSFTVSVDQVDTDGQVIPNVARYTDVHNGGADCSAGTCPTNVVKATVFVPRTAPGSSTTTSTTVAPTTTTVKKGGLAFTGADITRTIGGGVFLGVLGGFLVFASRRRRQ